MQIKLNIKGGKRSLLIAEMGSNSISMCVGGAKDPLKIDYPGGSILDMEIKEPSLLEKAISGGLKDMNIKNSDVLMIFDDSLCFEVDLSNLPATEQEVRYAGFLETVPFESILARKFRIDEKKMYGAAINRALFEFTKAVFASAGIQLVAATPASVAKQFGYLGSLDAKSCSLLYKKIGQLHSLSFLSEFNDQPKYASTQRHYINQHPKIFAGLSLGLVLVCMVTAMVTLRRPTPVASNSVVVNNIKSSPTPTITPTPTPIALNDLRVIITNGSRNQTVVRRLQSALSTAGVTKIEINTASVSSQTTQIAFSASVSQSSKEIINALVRSVFADVNTRDTEATDGAVLIFTGSRLQNTP